MNRISEHISYAEAVKSQVAVRKGIENIPNAAQLAAMKNVAEYCFEPLRNWHGKPIGITSFFRCELLNIAIGGSKTSQHGKGEAIDIDADIYDNGITNRQIFDWLRENVDFDQLIFEFGTKDEPDWVHVSSKFVRYGNRNEVLRAVRVDGHTRYEHFV